ncbi:MAG: hypothetical protein MJ252_24270 [archaeon]|nr:hypothetical protein [archaeon]
MTEQTEPLLDSKYWKNTQEKPEKKNSTSKRKFEFNYENVVQKFSLNKGKDKRTLPSSFGKSNINYDNNPSNSNSNSKEIEEEDEDCCDVAEEVQQDSVKQAISSISVKPSNFHQETHIRKVESSNCFISPRGYHPNVNPKISPLMDPSQQGTLKIDQLKKSCDYDKLRRRTLQLNYPLAFSLAKNSPNLIRRECTDEVEEYEEHSDM